MDKTAPASTLKSGVVRKQGYSKTKTGVKLDGKNALSSQLNRHVAANPRFREDDPQKDLAKLEKIAESPKTQAKWLRLVSKDEYAGLTDKQKAQEKIKA